ncbi:MAG: DUF2179 domain-containing protein [Candidatus Omnitrophica bacterium]|nr:DUF2179 domain-containing protein [Candidatus Omnitrophota bacterium]
MSEAFLNSSTFHWVVLPLLIFLARICDVTIGTVRILLLARGRKKAVPLLGFIEVMIWLLAVRQVLLGMDNIVTYIAFAGGFAMGNFIGMRIEERLAVGLEVIRVITRKDATELFEHLKKQGYGVTCLDAQGATGKVNLIFTVVQRCQHDKVISIIKQFNPKAFYSVEDVKSVSEGGVFPLASRPLVGLWGGK